MGRELSGHDPALHAKIGAATAKGLAKPEGLGQFTKHAVGWKIGFLGTKDDGVKNKILHQKCHQAYNDDCHGRSDQVPPQFFEMI